MSGSPIPAGVTTAPEAWALLATVLERQRTAACLYDSADRVVAWNALFPRVYPELLGVLQVGGSYPELVRRFLELNLAVEELPAIDAHVQAMVARHQKPHKPYIYQRKDGSWIRSEWRPLAGGFLLNLSTDPGDRPQLPGGAPDIMDVFANIDMAFALFAENGGFISANERYLALFPPCRAHAHGGADYADHLRCIAGQVLDPEELPRLLALAGRNVAEDACIDDGMVFRWGAGDWLKLEERRTASGGLISLWSDVSERVRAQTEVLRLKDRLTDAVESLADGFALYDAEDRLVICNTRYQEVSGFAVQPGQSWEEVVREGLRRDEYPGVQGAEELWLAQYRESRRRGESYEVQHRDGVWIRAIDRPTREGGIVSIRSDITALKIREMALSRQAALLSALSYAAARLVGNRDWREAVDDLLARLGEAAEVSRVLVFAVIRQDDGSGVQRCVFRWCAPAVLDADDVELDEVEPLGQDAGHQDWMARHARGEMIQARVDDLQGYLQAKFQRLDVRSLISVPIMVQGQWWGHISFEDCETPRRWSAVEIQVLETAALLFAGVVERSRMDTELRDSEQRFRGIAEALSIIITREGTSAILYASPPAAALLGWSVEDLIGRSVNDLYHDSGVRTRLLTRFNVTGALDDVEVSYRRADGELLPATLTTRRILYGGEWALISAITDLRERKSAEAEIARQREALHQADKLSALGSLLAGVAHELNNPLAVLVGRALMLEQDLSQEPGLASRAAKIRSAAERCDRIIKTFLAMARQRPVEQGEVRLDKLVESVLELTSYGLRASDIQVVRELATDLPVLWGGHDPLSQLVLNLVINAQQALQEVTGRRVLRVSAHGRGSTVVLEVADSGPGIGEALRERVFEPFYTTKPVGMGTGIGLSLCRSIVMTHGGSLTVGEAPEGGALFRVELPVREAPREAPAVAGGQATSEGVGAHQRILIVDDEHEIAELLGEILHQAGYRCEQVGSGREALARLVAGQDFDLIVSDIRMPDLDGPGLYRALREQFPALAERLVFITGDILGEQVVKELAGARIPVLEKPFRPHEVRQLVASRLFNGSGSGPR